MSTPASFAASNSITIIPTITHNEVFETEGKFKALLSSSAYTPTVTPTTNFNSTGNILQFSIQTNNKTTAFLRQIYMKFYWDVVYTGTAGATGFMFNPGSFDAVRAFPGLSCCNTMTLNLNNSATGWNLNSILASLLTVDTDYDDLSKKTAVAPSMTDTTQNYNDVFLLPLSATAPNPMLGTNWSPLSTYGNGNGELYQPRGAWPITVLTNTNVSAHIRFTTVEPVAIPPIGFFAKTMPLVNIDQFTIQMTMGNLNRCMSHIPGVGQATAYTSNGLDQNANSSNVTSLVATWYRSPEIHWTQITPGKQTIVPTLTIYPYTDVQIWPNTGQATLAPMATSGAVTVGSINLATNPSRIFIFVTNQQSMWDFNSTDTFHRITNISVNFDGQSGLLAAASEEQLIQMSVDNGYRGNQIDWQMGKGSVLILDLSKNLMLTGFGEAPGIDTKKNLQYTLTYQNINQAVTTTPVIWTVLFTPGLCTINNGFTTFQRSIMSVTDVLKAMESMAPMINTPYTDVYGGSLGSKVFGAVHGANKWMQRNKIGTRLLAASEHVGFQAHPAYGAAKMANQFLGYGIKNAAIGKKRRIVGGVPLSRNQLQQQAYEQQQEDQYDD